MPGNQEDRGPRGREPESGGPRGREPESGGPEVRWLWNGELRADALRRQIYTIRELGYRSAVVWAWAGLEVPFLSDDFLARLDLACAAAQRSGLDLWLADDVNWPSGTAGGRLLREHPAYGQRALVCASRWVPAGAPRAVTWRGEGEALALAVALDPRGGRRDLAGALAERGRPHREPRTARCGGHEVSWDADVWEAEVRVPPGDWFVVVATVARARPLLASTLGTRWSQPITGALAALEPRAVETFAALTLDRYAAAVGRWFSRSVKGVVTSPPPLLPEPCPPAHPDWHVDVLPWFDDLPAQFQARAGRSFAERLPYLLDQAHQVSHGQEPFRVFHDLAAAQFDAAYRRTLSGWCERHRLALREIAPGALPAVPYTLKGARRYALPLDQLAGRAAARSTPARGPAGTAGAAAWQADAGTAEAAGLPAKTVEEAAAAWQTVDGLAGPWEWQPQSLNVHPLDRWEGWPPDTAAPVERLLARATFDADYLPDNLHLVFEAGVVTAAALNGVGLPLSGARRPDEDEIELADESARVVALRGALGLRRGRNALSFVISLPAVERIALYEQDGIGPAFVAGSFALRREASGSIVVRPPGEVPLGPWQAAGYPRFSGTAIYRQRVALPDLPPAGTARLVVAARDGWVEALANGVLLERQGTSPGHFDLGAALRPGLNTLAVAVTSSLQPRLTGRETPGLTSVALHVRAPCPR